MRGILLNEATSSCIWCCLWTSVTGSLLVRPQTQTVPNGIRVVMKCSTDLTYSVDWHFVSVNGKEEEIYSSGVLSPTYGAEYKIEEWNPGGVYNLVIESAAERHAGRYICIDDEGLGSDTASATLIISKDVLQNEASEKTPGKTHDSKDTDTDDVGESVELVPQSTTIGEILVTATTSTTPLIVGLTVGLTIIGFAIITIIMLKHFYPKGQGICRGKEVDAVAKSIHTCNQGLLQQGTDKGDNKNLLA